MISKEHFLERITDLSLWKQIKIMKGSVEKVFAELQNFEPQDLDKAVKWLMSSDDRFDFHRLQDSMTEFRTNRLREEETKTQLLKNRSPQTLSDASPYTADCLRTICRGCPHIKNCVHRSREWLKGINAILRGNLGKNGAHQLIHFMKHDFMGGTDFNYASTPNPK